MTTSGTYAFAPDISEVVSEAFERCLIDPAALTARHMISARRSMNLLFAFWATEGVHLWAIDEQTQTLTASDATYNAPAGTLAVLDMVVRRSGVDVPVSPMAGDEYLAIPDKSIEGMPSRYWYEKLAGTSVIHLWNTPENSTDQIVYRRLRWLQDVTTGAETPDIPYFWYEALCSGVAAKLAEKFAPDREASLTAKAAAQLKAAKTEDRERTPTTTRVKFNLGLRRR